MKKLLNKLIAYFSSKEFLLNRNKVLEGAFDSLSSELSHLRESLGEADRERRYFRDLLLQNARVIPSPNNKTERNVSVANVDESWARKKQRLEKLTSIQANEELNKYWKAKLEKE